MDDTTHWYHDHDDPDGLTFSRKGRDLQGWDEQMGLSKLEYSRILSKNNLVYDDKFGVYSKRI